MKITEDSMVSALERHNYACVLCKRPIDETALTLAIRKTAVPDKHGVYAEKDLLVVCYDCKNPNIADFDELDMQIYELEKLRRSNKQKEMLAAYLLRKAIKPHELTKADMKRIRGIVKQYAFFLVYEAIGDMEKNNAADAIAYGAGEMLMQTCLVAEQRPRCKGNNEEGMRAAWVSAQKKWGTPLPYPVATLIRRMTQTEIPPKETESRIAAATTWTEFASMERNSSLWTK